MFGKLKDKISNYLQLRVELVRLELIERLVNVMGYVLFVMIVIFLVLTMVLFTGLGLAEWLSDVMKSRYGGYFATGGIVLLATIIVVLNSNKIIRFFANKFVALLTASKKLPQDEGDDDEDDKGA